MTCPRRFRPALERLRRDAVGAAASAVVIAAAGLAIAADIAAGSAGLNPMSSLRPSDLQAFRERPLFTPSRKPPPIAPSRPERAPVEAEAVDEAPNVRLTGVVLGASAAMAVLQLPDARGRSTVRIGDAVDGWTVTAIDAVSVRLASGTREREYRLFARDSLPVSGPEHAAAPDRGARIEAIR